MATTAYLKTVKAQIGRPLYLTVKDALCEAINDGTFRPGEQLPSTKNISQQLRVSLVTAHRAMQELVASGVVRRAQGRGTYVHDDVHNRLTHPKVRVGVLLHPNASLADYHHSMTMQGARLAAREQDIDLVLPRYDEDLRNECNGYLLISPQLDQINALLEHARHKPFIVAGSMPAPLDVSCMRVDNLDISQRAVDHFCNLGHRRIGYIGVDENVVCGQERWKGFLSGCSKHGLSPRDDHVIRSMSCRLDDRERSALARMLTASDSERPTAVFASGFWFAMDIYKIIIEHKIKVPERLSIIAVDDPPGAAHLTPPLTTFSRPLQKLGQMAMTSLLQVIKSGTNRPINQTLQADLIVRGSTSRAN